MLKVKTPAKRRRVATLLASLEAVKRRNAELEDLVKRAAAIALDMVEVAVGEAFDTGLEECDEDRLYQEIKRRRNAGEIDGGDLATELLDYMEIDSSWIYGECSNRDIITYDDDELREVIREGIAESQIVTVARDLILSRNDSDRHHFTRELRTELEREHNLN